MNQHASLTVQFSHASRGMPRQTEALSPLASSLSDTLKVTVFLIITLACRYYMTNELSNLTDGASERSIDVELQTPTQPPNLMDLSTVSL